MPEDHDMEKCSRPQCKHSRKAHTHLNKGKISEVACQYAECSCKYFAENN